MAIVSIDIGTSVAKVFAFDLQGNVLAYARESYGINRPNSGWAEQDPRIWWQAIVSGVRTVAKQISKMGETIEVIGLSGQMHGPVLLDKDGTPLLPCLIWMDTRAQKQAEFLNELLGHETLLSITGNLAVPAFPAAKLLWIKENLPHIFTKIRWVLMPKDYIGFCLTQTIATDHSDASGTLLYDIKARRWSDDLTRAIGLELDCLPPLVHSTQVLGKLTPQVARELSVEANIPVVIGAGDLITSAIGTGVIQPGKISLILGTAGQLLAYAEVVPVELLGKFYVFAHAIPSANLVLGTLPTGGAALAWMARWWTKKEDLDATDFANLFDLAKHSLPGAQSLIFVPYLAGTGTPHMDYTVTGAFVGLTENHGAAEIVRAVLEGVAYALRDSLEVLRKSGLPIEELRLAGGAIKNDTWAQIITDVFALPLQLLNVLDASPLGAFVLAATAAGHYSDLREVCNKVIFVQKIFTPTRCSKVYEKMYIKFQRVRDALRICKH
jgi:xylulokinase